MFAISVRETGLTGAGDGVFNQTNTSIPTIVGILINSALSILGVVFLVLIVYGGILWMTAQGDDKKVGNARGYIFHSILGLILVLSAYAITYFVVQKLAQPTLQ